MTKHNKTLSKKQKTIIYTLSAAGAVVAAVILVIILVHIIKNPPDVIFSSNNAAFTSSSSYEELHFSTDLEKPIVDNVNPDAPKINGVTNGAVYYTTQYVTVVGNNLKSISVNGENSNKSFYIDGNKTNIYVIEAIDSAENTTTYIIYTKPIATLSEPINHLNENTVTAHDYDTINNVKESVINLSTKYSSQGEATAINDILVTCEKYLSKIDYVAKKITELEKLVTEHQLSNDHTGVSQILNDINLLLRSENLTQKQRTTLDNLDYICQSMISNPPEPDYVY